MYTTTTFVFWFYTLLFTALTLYGLKLIHKNLRQARLIEDTPTSKIRSAAQGYVELDGWGEQLPGNTIVSPLTGTSCLWFSYEVMQRIKRDDDSTSWITLNSGTSADLFLIKDDSGECAVDPNGATITPSVFHLWYGETAKPHFRPPTTFFGQLLSAGPYCYREYLIKPLDKLYILGEFRSEVDSQAATELSDEVDHTLHTWKNDPKSLTLFDANGDGMIDHEEWQETHRAAERYVRAERRERLISPDTHLIHLPEDNRPFIISTQPQTDLSQSYRLSSTWGFIVFLTGFYLLGKFVTTYSIG